MGHGRRLQCPMEAPPLVTCLPSPPGCAHRGAGVVAPGLPGQWQGWHVPILLLPCPAGAGSSPEMPRRAAWRSLSRLWQQSQVHHGPKQDFWLLCSSLASDTVTVTVTCLPRNAGGAASWSWAGGCWGVAMGCSDAPVPPGEEIWVISSWLLVSPCPAWAPEGSRHWLLPTAAAPGLETLLLLGALVSCFAFPEVLEPKPPGWYLGSPACTDWCSRTTPSYCGWVALGAAGSDGCNGLKLVQRAQVEPQATKKYPWRCCGLSVFLQLSPGVGYFGSSGGTCLKARPPPPPPTGPRSPAAPAPQLEFPGAPPPARSPPLLEKLLSLEVEGGLGGKTLPPVRDLLQMPFAESFKTESDQLRLANERPDGRGGGLGEKEPCGLRQQVVLEPGWDLSSWQSPCPPPSSSLRRNCWCPLEGG